MYRRTEVARLHVGDEFVDASDIPHIVTGFTFHRSPASVTVHTDMYPNGRDMTTTDLVWRLAR